MTRQEANDTTITNLKLLAEHLRVNILPRVQAEEIIFNLRTFLSSKEDRGTSILPTNLDSYECGTSACAIGYAPQHPELGKIFLEVAENAGYKPGISNPENEVASGVIWYDYNNQLFPALSTDDNHLDEVWDSMFLGKVDLPITNRVEADDDLEATILRIEKVIAEFDKSGIWIVA